MHRSGKIGENPVEACYRTDFTKEDTFQDVQSIVKIYSFPHLVSGYKYRVSLFGYNASLGSRYV